MTMTTPSLSAWIGSALVTADTPVTDVQLLLPLLGPAPWSAWLEDPFDPDGLRLHDDLQASQVQLLPAGVQISEPTDSGPLRWRRWPQGHLFSPQAHLHWAAITPTGWQIVVITEAVRPALFDATTTLTLTPLHPGDDYLLLWGRYDADDTHWSEVRIPSLLHIYPAHWSGPYAAVVTRSYEADWPEYNTVRRVTRYLRYDGHYQPAVDPRFTEG